MQLNPRLPAKTALWLGLLLPVTALALDPAGWRHSQSVTIAQFGVVRIDLPPSTLNAAQPDLGDIRFLDPTGHEVSFLIEHPAPTPETSAAPQSFQTAINTGATTTVTLRAILTPISGVILQSPARRFIKSVSVESSPDGLTWTEIATDRPIFRTPGAAENLRIDLPAGTYSWLRLTINDRRDEPIPITSALLSQPASQPAPSLPLPVKIASRDESPGVTQLSLDLGAANLPVALLQVQTSDHLFTRSVSLAEPQIQDRVLSEQSFGEAVIYRLNLAGTNTERLDIPVNHQVNTRQLLLYIHNGDSAPLDIDSITATRHELHALFYASAPGTYTLLSGNSQCTSPNYDLAGLGDKLETAESPIIEPGPLIGNPTYKTPETLGSLTLQGGSFDPAGWKYRKLLPIGGQGAQQVEFDQDVLSHSSDGDFDDIRIVQSGHQIPFILEHTSIARTVSLPASHKQDADHPSQTVWTLDLPQPGLPISTITCASSSPLFKRSVDLTEEFSDERGDTNSRELGNATWSQTPGDQSPGGQAHPLVLSLNTAPQSGVLFLETDNGDNAPIDLHAFQGAYPVTRAIFKAAADPAQPIWLYYGNQDAPAPDYDLRLVAGDLLRAERQPITAGPEQPTSATAASATQTLTGASRYLFWAALALVVAGLLAITAKLLPGEKTAPPS